MSLFKFRSGGNLFRFRAINGFIKILFKRRHEDGKGQELRNKMTAKYQVSDER